MPLGGILGASWGLRGWSWEHLGALKVRLGLFVRSCGIFGCTWSGFGRLGVDLGASWAIVDVLGCLLGGVLGVAWRCIGVSWGLLGASYWLLGGIWELVMHSQHAESPIQKALATAVKHYIIASWGHLGSNK